MSHDDDAPQISAADLRDALRSRQAAPHPGLAQLVSDTAPEQTVEVDAEHGELMALRASVATLTERLEALEVDAEERRERELALRGGLRQLAHARGRRRRRSVVDELRESGLL